MSEGTNDAQVVLEGGCQCGEVRYRARAKSHDAYYCHCTMCQRAVGNVFAAFVNVKKKDVEWLTAPPKRYAASKIAERGFCGACGTPLTFEYHESENLDLTVGSLDAPGAMKPVAHFAIESRLASFHREDGLPGKRLDEVKHIAEKWKKAYGDDVVPGPRKS